MSLIPDTPQYSEEGAYATERSLETGLAALKQGDYKEAIAHLEGVLGLAVSQNTAIRAQMGLVAAYERTGDSPRAIAMCQNLAQSGQPKVEAWASKTLADFAKRYPHLLSAPYSSPHPAGSVGAGLAGEATNIADFLQDQTRPYRVPSDEYQDNSNSTLSEEASNITGFVPLDETPAGASDGTGFVAFDPKSTGAEDRSGRGGVLRQPNEKTDNLQTKPAHFGGTQDRRSKPQPLRSSNPKQSQATASDAAASADATMMGAETKIQSGEKTEETLSRTFPLKIEWRQAGRAQEWRPLKPIKLGRLLFVQVVTAIAVFWVIRLVVQFGMATTNNILLKLPYGQPIQAFYSDPTLALGIVLAILLCASPWLIDGLLKLLYGLQPLPLTQLATRSPESAKVLQRYCRQRRLELPTLGILPTSAPVALSYGNLPRTARIVISQGLLEQLAEDELATIYASELGHIVNWDFVLMSAIALVVQVPYTVYCLVAEWGDRMKAESEQAKAGDKKFYFFLFGFTFILAGVVAAISYAIYWLIRWPALWFSRARTVLGDRMAAEITGNPNGFTRALLKMAIGIATDVQKYRATNWLLEGLDLLMPLGHRQAMSLGSCYQFTGFEPLLKWDCTNPYRHWLVINYPHPLTGERLRILGRFAQFWQLDTELDLEAFSQPSSRGGSRNSPASRFIPLLLNNHKGLPLLESAILSGLVLGLVLKGTLWSMGGIANLLNMWQLIWLYQDKNGALLVGSLLIGFSISIFIHINGYFPDITPNRVQTEPSLPDLYANPEALPPDSQPVSLTGQLLGRRGISNWLAQDLILLSSTGLVKLNFQSQLGPLGNLWPQSIRPSDLVDRQVTVTGWLRRGLTPWIDLETLRTQGGRTCRAGYPVWLTILACAAAVWGAYIIWQSA